MSHFSSALLRCSADRRLRWSQSGYLPRGGCTYPGWRRYRCRRIPLPGTGWCSSSRWQLPHTWGTPGAYPPDSSWRQRLRWRRWPGTRPCFRSCTWSRSCQIQWRWRGRRSFWPSRTLLPFLLRQKATESLPAARIRFVGPRLWDKSAQFSPWTCPPLMFSPISHT